MVGRLFELVKWLFLFTVGIVINPVMVGILVLGVPIMMIWNFVIGSKGGVSFGYLDVVLLLFGLRFTSAILKV